MKHLFVILLLTLVSIHASAQPGAMQFEGPSRFGVAAMNAWQDNERDIIIFKMTSTSEADITLPAMDYKAMGLTIPSFTIHGLKFDYNAATRDATFADQTYTETITVDGAEKVITGYSFTAEYKSEAQALKLTTILSYGKMPVQVTYTIDAVYTGTAAIATPTADNTAGAIFDLSGRLTDAASRRGIFVQGGRKFIAR